ncbi:hypothetical protein niasHT_029373 [Heterodera trifolii]|uniref:UBC core domain-containing protein n=1 Tax=Heterodera trifolii TaxID=157864 RepID=A0ABD2J9V1_9BILA
MPSSPIPFSLFVVLFIFVPFLPGCSSFYLAPPSSPCVSTDIAKNLLLPQNEIVVPCPGVASRLLPGCSPRDLDYSGNANQKIAVGVVFAWPFSRGRFRVAVFAWPFSRGRFRVAVFACPKQALTRKRTPRENGHAKTGLTRKRPRENGHAKTATRKQQNYFRLSSSSLHCATTTALQKQPHRRFSSSIRPFLINSLAVFEMSLVALRRIKQELAELNREPVTGCTAAPIDDSRDLYHWKGHHPRTRTARVAVRMRHLQHGHLYHFNVGKDGALLMDILLRRNWAPLMTVSTVLLAISSLMCDPSEHTCALDMDIAKMYRHDREQYNRNAREWTQKHAMN